MSLVINQLSKRIDHHQTLDGISFEIGLGQIVGVVGRNGVGKTTLFRTINGQYLTDHGQVLVDGQEVVDQPEMRTQLCFIDPLANFFKGATIAQIQ